jgi:hypothetical protein
MGPEEEQLHGWHCLADIVRATEYRALGRPIGTNGEKCIEVLVGEGDGERQVERSERCWENNIKGYF